MDRTDASSQRKAGELLQAFLKPGDILFARHNNEALGVVEEVEPLTHDSPRFKDALKQVVKVDVATRAAIPDLVGLAPDQYFWEPLYREMILNDSDREIREKVINSMAKLGGEGQIELLKEVAQTDPDPEPVGAAVRGLGTLAHNIWPDELPEATPEQLKSRPMMALRIRGASPGEVINPEADSLLEFLDDARFNHPYPSVREVAEETLARLDP